MYFMSQMGYFIGRYPKSVLVITFLIVTPVISYFIWFPLIIETDIRRGFAHKNGASLREFERFANFYNVSVHDFEILSVLIVSKEGQSVPFKMSPAVCDDVSVFFETEVASFLPKTHIPTSKEVLDEQWTRLIPVFHGSGCGACEISRLDEMVTSLSLNSTKYGVINFSEFMVKKSSVNHAFHMFKLVYGIQSALAPDYDQSIKLSYPNSFVYGYTLPLTTNIFAAKVNERFQEEGLATAVESVNTIALSYIVGASGRVGKKRLQLWEIKLLEQSEMHNFSKHFNFYLYGDQVANYEAEKDQMKTVWMSCIGVFFMVIYIAYIVRKLPIKSQVLLTSTAIMSPLLACVTSFAVLGWLGVSFNSFMSLTPLLVLGIGVDDAFLLLHTWRKNVCIKDEGERMKRVVSEIGPSITITSLTNVLAFGVGMLSPAQVISLFCACTALAMAFDYVFELAVFAPCMVLTLTLRWEKEGGTAEKTDDVNAYWRRYAKFVLSKSGRMCAMIVVVLIYSSALFGLRKMETKFDASKTFPMTSPLTLSVQIFEGVYRQHNAIGLLVSSPPNFMDPSDLMNFMGMIKRLESHPDAYGRDGTIFWLFSYVEYCRNELGIEMSIEGENNTLSLDYLDRFASSQIIGDQNVVHYHLDEKGQAVIDSFMFKVAYKGADWHKRAELTAEIREFLRDYAQYNITSSIYDSPLFDLITSVKKELAKAVVITLCCMMCVCYIFIPNVFSTTIATLSILSISCSLMGMMSWWGLDVDPITMVSFIMAIGFSVDFSAHTCYHFHHYERSSHSTVLYDNANVVKLAHIFRAIGNPLIQAGASTVFCMLPLFTISSYVIRSFAKTVCLVVALGIVHGLFIVPSLLSLELWQRGSELKRHQRADKLCLEGVNDKENSLMI